MTGTLTVDGAAELAATLAHTSALINDGNVGYPAFTTLTPHLAEPDRRRQWFGLLAAAAQHLALDEPRTSGAAALDMLDSAIDTGDTAGVLLGLDPELYRAVSPADRPGETDYDGYDIAALTLDLATAWDTELVRRARAAVEPRTAATTC